MVLATRQFRRLGIKALTHLGLLETWSEVASCTHLYVETRSGCAACRTVQIGWHNDVAGMVLDCPVAQLLKRHVDRTIMRRVGTDIVDTGEDKNTGKTSYEERCDSEERRTWQVAMQIEKSSLGHHTIPAKYFKTRI